MKNIVTLKSRGCSMSFEMAPFDTSFTSSHFSSIITVVISCIISKIKQDTSRKS